MRTAELDYELPARLIATKPADRRDAARLLVLRESGGSIEHRHVHDLPTLLGGGDLVVINDTQVLPARFAGVRLATGGKVGGLFVGAPDERTWQVLLESGGKLRAGERVGLGAGVGVGTGIFASLKSGLGELELVARQDDGVWMARVDSELDTGRLLERIGAMPVPPYIQRQRGGETAEFEALDRARYQTVYARSPGAVAAPTAGLHFTDDLLEALRRAGVVVVPLTLHVGMGTFAPVRAETLEAHPMHREWFTVPGATIEAMRRTRAAGGRIVPVGTTCVRAMESLPDPLPTGGEDYGAETDLLIQPGFALRFCDGLMTNFHLPRSTLLALVAARTGLERLMRAYRQAIEREYRFYSYGDAMMVL